MQSGGYDPDLYSTGRCDAAENVMSQACRIVKMERNDSSESFAGVDMFTKLHVYKEANEWYIIDRERHLRQQVSHRS